MFTLKISVSVAIGSAVAPCQLTSGALLYPTAVSALVCLSRRHHHERYCLLSQGNAPLSALHVI
jgi:hypothetical protein